MLPHACVPLWASILVLMSSVGRPVPWTNWNEWRCTYEWLRSEDVNLMQKGLDKVRCNRLRGMVDRCKEDPCRDRARNISGFQILAYNLA